jgi:hypothetical protein
MGERHAAPLGNAAHLAPGRELGPENAKVEAATQQKPKSLVQLDVATNQLVMPGLVPGIHEF